MVSKIEENPCDGTITKSHTKNPYTGKVWFQFSFTPNIDHQHITDLSGTKLEDRMGAVRKWLVFFFNKQFNKFGIKYLQYIEVATPIGRTMPQWKGPLIHTHGIIQFPYEKFLKVWLITIVPALQRFGVFDIGTFSEKSNIQGWREYCEKDMDWMEEDPIHNVTTRNVFWASCKAGERQLGLGHSPSITSVKVSSDTLTPSVEAGCGGAPPTLRASPEGKPSSLGLDDGLKFFSIKTPIKKIEKKYCRIHPYQPLEKIPYRGQRIDEPISI